MANEAQLNQNKAAVLRFNREVIERGNQIAFRELHGPGIHQSHRSAGHAAQPRRHGLLRYVEHWGINTLPSVLAALRNPE